VIVAVRCLGEQLGDERGVRINFADHLEIEALAEVGFGACEAG
jgi:hypothetical protein